MNNVNNTNDTKDMKEIEVLDHGFVRLIDHMGSDMSVVRAARVSYDAEPRKDGSDEKLIDYLYRNMHTSPFEAAVFTFEVKAPIFVFRQWHRHRTWSYNEVSARYTELPEEFFIPAVDTIGEQSQHNKQMRDINGDPSIHAATEDLTRRTHNLQMAKGMEESNSGAFRQYKNHLNFGMPRELARTQLPLATYSRMFATVDLHNLFHFLRLRNHSHAQYEIRVYAQAMLDLIEPIVPACVSALKKGTKAERALKEIQAHIASISLGEESSMHAILDAVNDIEDLVKKGLQ